MNNSAKRGQRAFDFIGPYRVLSQVGGDQAPEDGRSATYFCEAGGDRFIVKVLICSPEFGGAARTRFERESTVGSAIGHPAVAAAQDVGAFASGR